MSDVRPAGIRRRSRAGAGSEVFLWFVAAFEGSAALVTLVAPAFGSGVRLTQPVAVGAALLAAAGAAAALAAAAASLSRRRRELFIVISAVPLAVFLAVALATRNDTGVAGLGAALLGLLIAARLNARDGTAHWHLLPTLAGTLLSVLGLAVVVSAAPGWNAPATGWPQAALFLASGAALLFGEHVGSPRARLAAAALTAFALDGTITRFLATEEWIPVLFASMLAIFLLIDALEARTLRKVALALLAVAGTNGTLHLVGTLYAAPGISAIASPFDPRELLEDLALVALAVGWSLRLRPPPHAREWSAAVAFVAIVAALGALPFAAAPVPGGPLKDMLTGQYATTLLILAFGSILVADPRLPRAATGPLLVALGSTALALSLDRALSIDVSSSHTHEALAFVTIALAIAAIGVIRARDGPIGGRISTALAGPFALLVVLFAVAGLAVRDLARGGTGALAPAATLAAAETSLAAIFIACVAVTVVGGLLLTFTITHPLRSLMATLGRQAGGDSSARSGFTQSDEIGVVGRALDHAIAELQRFALIDTLTGLPNRALFEDRFTVACATAAGEGCVGLATVDLDQFRLVNESLGHAAGDMVIRETGRRLVATLRPRDTVARLGGDEFGIVLSPLSDVDDAEARIHACLAAVRRPLSVEGHVVHLTAAAGLTVGATTYGSFNDFLRGADLSMTNAKKRGGDELAVAPASPAGADTDQMRLAADLHLALERDEVFLVYQPIVDIASRTCERVEALARWRHADRGLIMPTEFIALAERAHLIRSLGHWVLEHALDDLVALRSAGRSIGVCVNVAAPQLSDSGFVDAVLRAVSDRGLLPGVLTLELTESTFIDRDSKVISDLERLRSAGVRISIDDFGTGYSSVAQLGELPVDEVKVDQSFVAAAVSDPGRAAVVRATVALAGAFHLPFVAEGVEDRATWDFLRELEHGSVQGYFVSRPMLPEALAPWLASWHFGDPVPERIVSRHVTEMRTAGLDDDGRTGEGRVAAGAEPDLARRAAAGDRLAFVALFEIHVDAIYRYAFYRMRSDAEAGDVTGEVFRRALIDMPSYDPRLPVLAYLYAIARGIVADRRRERAPSSGLASEHAKVRAGVAAALEATGGGLDEARRLRPAIARLSLLQQEIVILRYLEGWPVKAVAALTGTPESTIDGIQMRALAELHGHLDAGPP